jgi:hypothetical protein
VRLHGTTYEKIVIFKSRLYGRLLHPDQWSIYIAIDITVQRKKSKAVPLHAMVALEERRV